MTMSLHRITAGSGYDYLTRQVAAMDSTEKGRTGLASYYTEKGEVPGRWVGSGMAGIDGLNAGDLVTAEQMQALFGSGHHPLADEHGRAAAARPGATEAEVLAAVRLGQPFKVYRDDVSAFRVEVARRFAAVNKAAGRPRDAAISIGERARIRTEVGREFFRRDFGRAPLDERELAAHIARLSRQRTTAVAGFDLTFSAVKSVSALWAVAEPALAAVIERAHQAAVADALRFIEQRALFTRTGTNGVRQVDVRGLIGTAFTHRDSRAGDPDLHTHVATVNKVQTVTDGRWLSIDSRVLYKAITAASETYNTALEAHLAATVGVRFEARPQPDPRKRPVREIVGVDPALLERWSSRRHRIVARQGELAAQFQIDHGRPPTPVEAISLAQQATLETRDAKHEPRSLAEQRASWHAQARQVLGSDDAIQAMIRDVLHPAQPVPDLATAAWFDEAARRVAARVERDRSAWQIWHVHAEALRQVRGHHVPAERVAAAADHLTGLVLDRYSVPLSPPTDGISEPSPLRRADGQSVYTVAGSRLFTSTGILAAEQRIVANAGRRDGRTVPAAAVDVALLETAANGVELNAGQIALVREMATSGARIQLAIAPAGAGKTTAMQALARAWTGSGGTVIGLAPSAVAAAGLGEQIDAHADTLAKLAWHLTHGDPPAWIDQIGPDTLVIVDEAGMADTLALDTVTSHILQQGGSVRLIGDNQQLAAIGAGGVLRDIDATHGALRLTELVRFTNPAEGSASLALRDGQPEALGFYLDHHRVRIGNPDSMTEQLFTAWADDRQHGQDSVMLAPTRDLVAQLNQRARNHRLAGTAPTAEVQLADGNRASVGDIIITRRNDRRLRINATDWVKNGDRWTIHTLTTHGVQARHTQSGRHITLPSDYLESWTELGYACTTHTAQGVTADTCHGLLTGDETRQQAYTMLTRGRHSNTAYLTTVGDGDPHSLIHPDTINPATPTDQLERILARDESPLSATTQLRHAADPAVRLSDACDRYQDAIVFAAGHIASDADRHTLAFAAERVIPNVTKAEAWPALLAQLLTIEADRRDSIEALTRAAADPLTTGRDPAAVLTARLDNTITTGHGPLPWLRPIPTNLHHHRLWGGYLAARADLVIELATQVQTRAQADGTRPAWVGDDLLPPASLVADIEVWRAATHVPATDRRPTGEPHHHGASARWQHRLTQQIATLNAAAIDEWAPLLTSLDPQIGRDPYLATLATRVARLSSAGINIRQLIHHAAGEGPLPDDHAAAALWWRLSSHLTPAVAHHATSSEHLTTDWTPHLRSAVGEERAAQLEKSSWWPALVTAIDHGLRRGWTLDNLLTTAPTNQQSAGDDCQAWVWRLTLATQTPPDADVRPDPADHEPPADLHEGWTPTAPQVDMLHPNNIPPAGADEETWIEDLEPDEETVDREADRILAFEAMVRATMGPPEPTDAEIQCQLDRRDAWNECPYTPERLAHINELTTQYYEQRLPGSWAQPYLTERLQQDITGHPTIRPGYAPNGWTTLVHHLRAKGVTDDEMLTAGVATTASTGRLIDRFRDRLVFPITHNGQVLGFVGRRNPAAEDDKRIPKYLNTGDTPLFHKGDQLYATGPVDGTIPVLVEGPMDAIAITLTMNGTHTGVAPLGTALTEPQATQLAKWHARPVIATDSDHAGRAAAERDYWLVAAKGGDARYTELPETSDPASLLTDQRTEVLRAAIAEAAPLTFHLIEWASSDGPHHLNRAIFALAAAPPERWPGGEALINELTPAPAGLIRSALASTAASWNADPSEALKAAAELRGIQAVGPKAQARTPNETPSAPLRHRHCQHPTRPQGPSVSV
ncbi:MAG: MobF family relaxase [Micropruina sp.]|uniref:MobF family relaxase n=1 Tax=Micropruina sp. TaxID=2737536 RepID=UPI0039E3131A